MKLIQDAASFLGEFAQYIHIFPARERRWWRRDVWMWQLTTEGGTITFTDYCSLSEMQEATKRYFPDTRVTVFYRYSGPKETFFDILFGG